MSLSIRMNVDSFDKLYSFLRFCAQANPLKLYYSDTKAYDIINHVWFLYFLLYEHRIYKFMIITVDSLRFQHSPELRNRAVNVLKWASDRFIIPFTFVQYGCYAYNAFVPCFESVIGHSLPVPCWRLC